MLQPRFCNFRSGRVPKLLRAGGPVSVISGRVVSQSYCGRVALVVLDQCSGGDANRTGRVRPVAPS
jgi:hypothetical protein